MDKQIQTEIEAAMFRNLIQLLQRRTDLNNADLMKHAGFCRDCLGHWYQACAENVGFEIDIEQAKAKIYGMPTEVWQDRYVVAPKLLKKNATQKEKNKPMR